MIENQPQKSSGGLFEKLRRLILNKSGQRYLSELTGGDAYWDRIIAAQARCDQPAAGASQPPKA